MNKVGRAPAQQQMLTMCVCGGRAWGAAINHCYPRAEARTTLVVPLLNEWRVVWPQ